MALRIDTSPRYGQMAFDSYPASAGSPHYSDHWPATGYASSQTLGSNLGLNSLSRHHGGRTSVSSTSSLASYDSLPSTTATTSVPLSGAYAQQDILGMQNLLSLNRLPAVTAATYAEPTYTTAASPIHPSYAATAAPYDALGYNPAPLRSTFAMDADAQSRRYAQAGLHEEDRRGFADALGSRGGVLPMNDETPRNIYGTRSDRSATDSYGFPPAHSTSSPMSSNGNLGSYYGDSVSDYSTAGSDIESVTSRPLSRAHDLMTRQPPPAPQSMMGQFSSKVSSSTQKKHKCKVCDKRFMRPSSLQTHMYSHTGEKRESLSSPACHDSLLTRPVLQPLLVRLKDAAGTFPSSPTFEGTKRCTGPMLGRPVPKTTPIDPPRRPRTNAALPPGDETRSYLLRLDLRGSRHL
jgi:hypothetical protein